MGRLDTYSQPDAPDPVLSPQTIAKIAAAHTKHAGDLLEIDESGGEARAYLLAGDVVVKTQRPHRLRPRTSLAKEARLLEHLAPTMGALIPQLHGYGRLDAPEGDVEYLVISRIPGRAVRHVNLTGENRLALLFATGLLLAQMHAAETAPLAVEDGLFATDDDGAALRVRLEAGFADLADSIAAQPGTWTLPITPEAVAERALAVLPEHFTPVALHSNPGPTHVFCDENGRLTGVIDFGDAYLSHQAMDLRTWPDPVDRLLLRTGYFDGAAADAGFDAVWNAAMIYTDVAVMAGRPELAEAAAADLVGRLDI